MFEGVRNKLERATYFLNNIKALEKEAGGFSYIKKQQEMRANLDAFFFEIVSAKDFFLQGINIHYKLNLKKQDATHIDKLINCLVCKNELTAKNMVSSIKDEFSNKNSWLWRLNNYRNSATHRELLHFGHKVKVEVGTENKELFDKMQQGKIKIVPILSGQENMFPPDIKKIKIPPDSVRTYLFKDPEDSSQGNADTEVIPYCEESLQRMKSFLEEKYSGLGI